MRWVALCLKNKLLIYLAAVGLCCLGLFAITQMPMTPFPLGQHPQISIQFSYPGANAQTVQKQVTSRVVDAMRAISNVQSVFAQSSVGSAQIMLVLSSNSSTNLLQTQIEVSQAISASHLPVSVSAPVISTTSSWSSLLTVTVTSKQYDTFKINNFIQSRLYPKLSGLPGVFLLFPTQHPEIKIELQPVKLARYGLSAVKVAQHVEAANQATPLGQLYLNQKPYILTLNSSTSSLAAFRQLIIGYLHSSSDNKVGTPVRLGAVATISFAPQSIIPTAYSEYNGKVVGEISLATSNLANPFSVSQKVHHYVQQLNQSAPGDIKLSINSDSSIMMLQSIHEVVLTIAIASVLVLLIALVFLGRFSSTVVPVLTIPICLLGAFFVIWLLGYSINFVTLLAMVIAVGLVVDDAIVVVENVTRYIEEGKSKKEAVIQGAAEIALTIIGITLTLLAVYLPIVFLSAGAATMLKSFAIPLAMAVLISGVVALTLTPVLSMIFVTEKSDNAYQVTFNHLMHRVISVYQTMLSTVIRLRWFSVFILALLITLGGYFCIKLPHDIFAPDPNGNVRVTLTATPQDTIQTLIKQAHRFTPYFHNKMVDKYFISVNKDPNLGKLTANILFQLKDRYLRQSAQFSAAINDFIRQQHISHAAASMMISLNSGDGLDLSYQLYGGADTAHVNQMAEVMTKLMRHSPVFSLVENDLGYPVPQLSFKIDAVKAASLGLYQSDIAQLLSTYYGGMTLSNEFSIDGLTVPIVVQLDSQDRKNPSSIQNLMIRSPLTQKDYSLSQFVDLKTVAKPLSLSTLNGQPSVSVMANIAKGFAMGDAITAVNQLLRDHMPSMQIQYDGNARSYLEGNKQTVMIAALGLLCIYTLLALVFQSLLDPLIILLTVPFSVIGGALSLYWIHSSLNVFSILGLITLVGLITKHGVLIVHMANDDMKRGLSVREAILSSTRHRFRPIIMTTLAMVFGALPLILGGEQLYVSRLNLGMVLISGLVIGTLFSLFIVPLVYSLLKKSAPASVD